MSTHQRLVSSEKKENQVRLSHLGIIPVVNCLDFFPVAQRVVQKSPLKVSGCELKISPFIVEPMVRVSGISRSISDDMLELFFESEKRSGGGDIKKIDKYPASDMVIITFDDEQGRLLAVFCEVWYLASAQQHDYYPKFLIAK